MSTMRALSVRDLVTPWESSLPGLARSVAKRQCTTEAAATALFIWIGVDVPASAQVTKLRQTAFNTAWARVEELLAFEDRARRKAVSAIAEALRPLIARRAPKNRLLSEAHDVNVDLGSPLSEDEIEPAVGGIVEEHLASQRAEAASANV